LEVSRGQDEARAVLGGASLEGQPAKE
jgi:hypothetical protein